MSAVQGFSYVIMSMEKRLGFSELSIISWVSTVEVCPLNRVTL